MRPLRWLTLGMLSLALGGPAARLAAWSNEVYVWQRQGNQDMTKALADQLPQLDGVAVLYGEIAWRQGRPVCQRFPEALAATAAARSGHVVGIVVRIGAYSGSFDPEDQGSHLLAEQLKFLVATAEMAGAHVSELQIDFDCPESKLSGYATWLEMFRRAVPGRQLVFTALPTWLGKPGLEQVVAAADGFVLQVHALEKPERIEDLKPLCDVARVPAWVRAAAALGKPFRVALPTYAYFLSFDAQGQFEGFVADGSRARLEPGFQVRELRAEESEMARLALALRAEHPDNCLGLLWFRLPIGNERLNWSPEAFARIVRGEVPQSSWRLTCVQAKNGSPVFDFLFENDGWASVQAPSHIELAWDDEDPQKAPVSADGLGPYKVTIDVMHHLIVVDRAPEQLPPRVSGGGNLTLGWVRFQGALPHLHAKK